MKWAINLTPQSNPRLIEILSSVGYISRRSGRQAEFYQLPGEHLLLLGSRGQKPVLDRHYKVSNRDTSNNSCKVIDDAT